MNDLYKLRRGMRKKKKKKGTAGGALFEGLNKQIKIFLKKKVFFFSANIQSLSNIGLGNSGYRCSLLLSLRIIRVGEKKKKGGKKRQASMCQTNNKKKLKKSVYIFLTPTEHVVVTEVICFYNRVVLLYLVSSSFFFLFPRLGVVFLIISQIDFFSLTKLEGEPTVFLFVV